MTLRKTLAVVAVAALAGWFANSAFTEDDPQPSEMEMWSKILEVGKPGEAHAILARMAGDWTCESTMYSKQGEMTSEATSSAEMINGGRFLLGDYTGDIMGQPFEGRSLLGHNNVTGKYQMIWVDSMNSGIYSYEGTCNEDKSKLTAIGESKTPFGVNEEKLVLTFDGDDKYTFEGFGREKGSKADWQKQMQIVYTREKDSE